MKSTKIKLGIGALAVIAVVSSVAIFLWVQNSNAPLESIKTFKPSHDYGQPYWIKEKNADSKLWNQAVAYCDATGESTPGCLEVEATRGGLSMDVYNKYKNTKFF